MPTAICNQCESLVHWPYGQHQKKQSCSCGSKELTQVKGELKGDTWEYSDRHGTSINNSLIWKKK
jgi:hypothetical protein